MLPVVFDVVLEVFELGVVVGLRGNHGGLLLSGGTAGPRLRSLRSALVVENAFVYVFSYYAVLEFFKFLFFLGLFVSRWSFEILKE